MNKKNNLSQKNIIWDQWFAGIVDGDGYFYIKDNKEITFELTTAIVERCKHFTYYQK